MAGAPGRLVRMPSQSSPRAAKPRKRRLSKRQRQMYRRRRIAVLVGLVAFLALAVFCVYSLVRGASLVPAWVGADERMAVTRATQPPVPVRKSKVRVCSANDIELALDPASASVPVGGSLEFTARITYTGKDPAGCYVDGEKNKKTELSENVQLLLQSKGDYYDLANVSTETEINKASTEEVYTTEYLWLRVGRHARNEGVNIRMEILTGDAGDSSIKNIDFTVDGAYVAIMDFISAIEDDSELAFRIENFNMLPSGDNLQATFSVTGIRIRQEQTTTTVDNTTDTTTGPTTNTEGTTDTSAQS